MNRTGGEVVCDALVTRGVTHVFGVPSIHNLPIVDAIEAHPGLDMVGVRHEQAAAHAADGYARVTGRLGVCLTSTGPGAANAVAGLLEAGYASSPVLMITGQVETADLGRGRGALHEADDQLAMLRAVTHRAESVRTVDDLERVVQSVVTDLLVGRPRPGAVEIPIDVQYARTDAPPVRPDVVRSPAPAADVLDRAAALLAEAERPLVWAGGGAVGASAELTALAEQLGAPVLTSVTGRGAIAETHPLCVGPFADLDPATELIAEADVVLAVGTRLQAGPTRRWTTAIPGALVHLDVDPTVIGRNYPADVRLGGDARESLAGLRGRLAAVAAPDPAWSRRGAERRSEVSRRIRARIGPDHAAILDTIDELLPAGSNVVRDATVPAYVWANRILPVRQARTSLHPTWSGIGPGLPLALGAAVGNGRTTVLVVGDGGLMLSVGELAALAQRRLPVIVCVFDDHGYGVLRGVQDAAFGRRAAVDLATPDFAALGAAMGVTSTAVKSADDFRAAFDAAVRSREPALLAVDMQSLHPIGPVQ